MLIKKGMRIGGLFLNIKKAFLKIKEDRYFKILLCLMLLISVVLFWDFIIYKRVYIYNDIGGDTHATYLPVYKYIITHLKHGNLKWWSFNFGIGTSILSYGEFIFDPFNIILLLVPIKYLHYGILIVSLIKIYCAGIIFYLYILKIGVKEYAALIASLAWAFSGYIILWGQHYQFASMIVLFSLIMLSFEYWFQDNNKLPLILSIALLAINSPYWMYMVSIYIFMYGFIRYLYVYKYKIKEIIKYVLNLAAIYIIGIGVSCIVFLPRCYVLLNSPRVSGANFQIPLHWDKFFIFSSVTRIFSNNLMGTSYYYGNWNYYEIPILCSTLIVTLILPQLFLFIKGKAKKILILNTVIVVLFVIIPLPSVIFNAFSTLSIRWTFLLLFTLIIALGKTLYFIFQSKTINTGLLVSTFIVDVGVLLYSIMGVLNETGVTLNKQIVLSSFKQSLVIIIFLCLYLQMFIYLSKRKNSKYIKYLLIIFTIEMIVTNYQTINSRITLTPNYFANSEGYADRSNDAIVYINSIDKDFKRVNKDFWSIPYTFWTIGLNDAIYQEYYGLKSYNSLNQPSYIEFIKGIDGEFFVNHTNHILGFDDRYKIQTFLGVKYLLSKNNIDPLGYQKIKSIDNIKIYKNNYSLPLGFTYNSFITLNEFKMLSKTEKDDTLLSAFVIDKVGIESFKKFDITKLISKDENNINLIDKNNVSFNNIKVIQNNFPQSIKYVPLNVDPMLIIKVQDNKSNLKLKLNIKTGTNSIGQVFYRTNETSFNEETSIKFDIDPNKLEYEINLNKSDISEIRIDVGQSNSEVEITNLTVGAINIDSYVDAINNLKKYSLDIDEFSDSKIKGKINVDEKRMLFLSIPYDAGWHLWVDGKKAEIQKINIGFMGTVVDKGNHTIELVYIPPWLNLGAIITMISIGIVVAMYLYKNKNVKACKDKVV